MQGQNKSLYKNYFFLEAGGVRGWDVDLVGVLLGVVVLLSVAVVLVGVLLRVMVLLTTAVVLAGLGVGMLGSSGGGPFSANSWASSIIATVWN